MKKIYKNPELKVVKIQTTKMIAASLGFGAGVDNANGAEARRGGSLWDDEEDFE